MTDRNEWQRRNVAPGWAELRIVCRVVEDDTDEFHYTGRAAAVASLKWCLSYASGIAAGAGWTYLSEQMFELWDEIERKLGIPSPRIARVPPKAQA
jgi:hypothetical protein